MPPRIEIPKMKEAPTQALRKAKLLRPFAAEHKRLSRVFSPKEMEEFAIAVSRNSKAKSARKQIESAKKLEMLKGALNGAGLGAKFMPIVKAMASNREGHKILDHFGDKPPRDVVRLAASMPYLFESEHGGEAMQIIRDNMPKIPAKMRAALRHSEGFEGVYRTAAALSIYNAADKKGRVPKYMLESIKESVSNLRMIERDFEKHGMHIGIETEIPKVGKGWRGGMRGYEQSVLFGIMPGMDKKWEFEVPYSRHFMTQQLILSELKSSGLIDRKKLLSTPSTSLHISVSGPEVKMEDAEIIARILASVHASPERISEEDGWRPFVRQQRNRIEFRAPQVAYGKEGSPLDIDAVRTTYYLSLAASKGWKEWRGLKNSLPRGFARIGTEEGHRLPSREELQPKVSDAVLRIVKRLQKRIT